MRLSESSLAALPDTIARPTYDRRALGVGIVHLGTGAFHKAHQAVYTDTLLARSPADWMITGASLRSPSVRDALSPQDYLYSVWEKGGKMLVVGAIKEVLFAPESTARLIEVMASPTTRIISLTITEKGYYRSPDDGTLRLDHPDIRADLAHPDQPTTAIGYIGAALRRRRAIGAPVSILSCDNLPHNGAATRTLVLAYCDQLEPGLATWIKAFVTFPATMVDRIVPATTEADQTGVADTLGMIDHAGVTTEPFSQWVIEDNFATGRPDWEQVGAVFTLNVEPFETMKLRLLNGAHSAIAYLGYLAGHTFVNECMADGQFVAWLDVLMDKQILPTVQPPAGYSLDDYVSSLKQRFCNPHLAHRCLQIAMDGSQKLPQRQLETVRDRLANGQSIDALALAIAAWMIFVTGKNLHGATHEVNDPLAMELLAMAAPHAGSASNLVRALVGFTPVFGEDLQHSPVFVDALIQAASDLYECGVHNAMTRQQVTR